VIAFGVVALALLVAAGWVIFQAGTYNPTFRPTARASVTQPAVPDSMDRHRRGSRSWPVEWRRGFGQDGAK
jgi:hypothetical protein